MPTPLYNWKIAGEAGYGIMNTGGPIFAKTVMRAGFFVFIYSEYPSLIRGGHNTMQVAVDKNSINAPYEGLDQLVALNTNAIVVNQDEVKPGGVIIYDPAEVKVDESGTVDNKRIPPLSGVASVARARKKTAFRKDVTYIPIEFGKIAEEVGGNKIMRNVAAIGASLAVSLKYGIKKRDLLNIAKGVLADIFAKKGEKIIQPNQNVIEAAFKAVQDKK